MKHMEGSKVGTGRFARRCRSIIPVVARTTSYYLQNGSLDPV
jgi:hypothetical protein